MKKAGITIVILILLIPFLFFIKKITAQGAQVYKSGVVQTAVGNPTDIIPPVDPPPTGNTSCPVEGGYIGCGSYGQPIAGGSGFSGACAASSNQRTGEVNIGGHCGPAYRSSTGICQRYIERGNLVRTAKSIDVAKPSGSNENDPIKLPSLRDKNLKWTYRGQVAGDNQGGARFGMISIYTSEQTPEGIYTLHFVHVKQNATLKSGDQLNSGEVGDRMFQFPRTRDDPNPWNHAHITLGLNVPSENPFANDLQAFDPNWKFADRDFGMCMNKTAP